MSLKLAKDISFSTFVTVPSHLKRVIVTFMEDNNEEYKDLECLLLGISSYFSVVLINKKDSPKLFKFYKIERIPTILLFRNGKEVNRIEGKLNTKIEFDTFVKEIKPPKKTVRL